MSRIYENWERLVEATIRREDHRLNCQRTFSDLSSSSSSSSSSFGFPSFPRRLSSFNFSRLLVGNSFTHHQILQATSNLSESNLIKQGHSGDLFYGVLEDRIQVVVKKIDLSSVKIESYYFISELEILHKISHSRIVPFLGHCLENMNDKFMVYKYMPNKDLSSYYLHGKNVSGGRSLSLDWTTRMKIAIGAAEGLCYLHRNCVPPIVHGDVQASSILLDEDFEVRLGSLSEVCTAVENYTSESWISKFLRMPKNAEQQGASGASNATCAHDVYCFGKLLLQLVTGKLLLWEAKSWKDWKDLTLRIYDKELVRRILDPSLLIREDLFMEVWAVAIIARACLHPKPSRRPQIPQVLKALTKGKISETSDFEMKRTIESYRTFFGPISPKFFK